MIDRRKFKATSIYVILQDIIDTELNDIEKYIEEVAGELLEKQKKVDKDYEAAIKQTQSEDGFYVNSFFEDDIHKYHRILPIYTFNPTLLMLYGLFENWLKKLCDYHHRRKFSEIKVNDLAGNNYIEKSRKYLNLVADIDLSSVERVWQQIAFIQKVRNCIAHNNSNLITNKNAPIEKQELFNYIKSDTRFYLDEKQGNFFIQDKEVLKETIHLFKQYLSTITSQLSKKNVYVRNTSMPFDNTSWGQEKTETLLKDVIHGLELLDLNDKRTDEFKDTDLKFNLRGHFASMAWNLTKLYSFFCDGDWEVKDRDLICNKREEGLEDLKKIYKSD
jgi:hypothetical protein